MTSLADCPTCFRERYLTDSGECAGCVADAEREEERQRREAARAYDRGVLGFHPAAKSLAFTRIAIDAALYWSAWATTFVGPADAAALEGVRVRLAALRKDLPRAP